MKPHRIDSVSQLHRIHVVTPHASNTCCQGGFVQRNENKKRTIIDVKFFDQFHGLHSSNCVVRHRGKRADCSSYSRSLLLFRLFIIIKQKSRSAPEVKLHYIDAHMHSLVPRIDTSSIRATSRSTFSFSCSNIAKSLNAFELQNLNGPNMKIEHNSIESVFERCSRMSNTAIA